MRMKCTEAVTDGAWNWPSMSVDFSQLGREAEAPEYHIIVVAKQRFVLNETLSGVPQALQPSQTVKKSHRLG